MESGLPPLEISLPKSKITFHVDQDAQFEISVLRRGPSQQGPVEVTFADVPAGLDLLPITIPMREEIARVPLRADAECSGRIRVRAATEQGCAEAEFEVEVPAAPEPASIAIRTPDSLQVPAGQMVTFPVKVERRKNSDPIAVRFEGVPEGIRMSPVVVPADRAEVQGEATAAREVGEKSADVRVIASAGALRAESTMRVTLRPSPARLARLRGDSSLERKEYHLAITEYREAIRLDPADSAAFLGLARALSGSGDWDGAISACDEAIRFDQTNHQAYATRADARHKKGDRADAIGDLGEALRLRPNDAGTLNRRGVLFVGASQPYKAIADFDEAIRINPNVAAFHYNRGWIYDRLGDTVEAMFEYERALRLDPKLAAAYKARGAAYARRGDSARARADLDEAARLEGSVGPLTQINPAPAPAPGLPATSPPANSPAGEVGVRNEARNAVGSGRSGSALRLPRS